jgi:hypothetical protein
MRTVTLNRFMVSMAGDEVVIMLPPKHPINREEALVLAAYLVSIAEVLPGTESFEDILKQVQAT